MRRAATKSIIRGLAASRLMSRVRDTRGRGSGFLRQGPAKDKELGRIATDPPPVLDSGFSGGVGRVLSGRGASYIAIRGRPRGGVVTQRSAKPCTPVQFRAWPPASICIAGPVFVPRGRVDAHIGAARAGTLGN